MLQDIKLKTEAQNQFLGDLFEGFLDQGIKQSEGQFFTPLPIVRFLISSLPLQQIIQKSTPNVIDYACGAGHFLTEFASQIKPIIIEKFKTEIDKYSDEEQKKTFIADLMKKYNQCILGIEKEYRLSKVSKVSAFMYGQDGVNIIYADALTHIDKVKNNSFDVLVANPPYSVKGFLETLTEDEQRSFELFGAVSDLSKNNAIETFFVERAKQLLRTDGVAAIILPVSVLDKSGIYTKCREIILKHFDIIAIFESGSGTFGKTGTNTSTLFLRRRPCDKDGNTDIVEHYNNRVNTWFAGCFDNDTYYDDYPLFEQYCSRIEVKASDYKTLFVYSKKEETDNNTDSYISMAAEPIAENGIKRTWRNVLSKYEIFESYIAEFENDGDAKKIKQQIEKRKKKLLKGKYTQEIKDMELADLNKKFEKHVFDSIVAIEKEKLLFFLLANSNRQKVIVVRTPNIVKNSNTTDQQKFLGYEWSGAKGNEGIKYLGSNIGDDDDNENEIARNKGINSIQTPLFNPHNLLDSEKINSVIRQNFQNGASNIPEQLMPFVSIYKLVDMLDFTRVSFDKQIKTSASQKIEIESKFLLVKLGDIAEVLKGKSITSAQTKEGNIKVVAGGTDYAYLHNEANRPANTITISASGANAGFVNFWREPIFASDCTTVRGKNDLHTLFLYNFLLSIQNQIFYLQKGSAQPHVYPDDLKLIQIPNVDKDIQQQIVSECEKVDEEYNNSRMSIEEYRKKIAETMANVKGEMKRLGDVADFRRGPFGGSLKKEIFVQSGYKVYEQQHAINNDFSIGDYYISEKYFEEKMKSFELLPNDIIVSCSGTIGKVAIFPKNAEKGIINQALLRLRKKSAEISIEYFARILSYSSDKFVENSHGSGLKNVVKVDVLKDITVPVPSLAEQQRIVSEIESYEAEIADAKAVMNGCAERKKKILEKYLK